ncbi:unnamed protein product [Calypogeia fissa]
MVFSRLFFFRKDASKLRLERSLVIAVGDIKVEISVLTLGVWVGRHCLADGHCSWPYSSLMLVSCHYDNLHFAQDCLLR